MRVAVTLSNPQAIGGTFTEIVQDSGPITGAVTFTATPLPGQEPPTSLITQPTLFIDLYYHTIAQIGWRELNL